MRSERGVSWQAWVLCIALLVALALFLRWALRSDAQVLSDSIDEARDALVENRDEDFLAFFAPDVAYQRGGNFDSLQRDLSRWHGYGISEVFILSREIELEDDGASIRLVVAVGSGLLQIARVDVDLEAQKDAEGEWRVRAFSWRRP